MTSIAFPPAEGICSRLAFGTGRLHGGDLANMEATVRRAYDVGIRHFDSSVHYDNAAPHAALARLLRDVREGSVFISTKIGYIRPTFPAYRSLYRNRDALLGIVHECFRMLLGRIDLLQIHEADRRFWWEPDAPDVQYCFLEPDASYDFLSAPGYDVVRSAKANGVCRYIGITGNSSRPLARVADALDVDSVMCAYNLDPVFRGVIESVVPIARPKGQTILSAGVLQHGLFRTPYELPDFLRRSQPLVDAFAAFGAIQREAGIPAVELVARWALSVDSVDKWVLGASHPDQIEELVSFMRKGALPTDLQVALDGLATPGLDRARFWT